MAKAKRGFLDYKRTYDTSEGFGNEFDWRQAFNFRLGLDKSRTILKDRSPRAILGVSILATWEEIKKAYRALVMTCHPDKPENAGNEELAEKFLSVQAAYEMLESEFGRK